MPGSRWLQSQFRPRRSWRKPRPLRITTFRPATWPGRCARSRRYRDARFFSGRRGEGAHPPPVKGHLTLGQALRSALAGSPLVVESRAGAALVHERPPLAREQASHAEAAGAITVTGTRIRGAGSASPVTVPTRQALEQAGIDHLAGFAPGSSRRITPAGRTRESPAAASRAGNRTSTIRPRSTFGGLGPERDPDTPRRTPARL